MFQSERLRMGRILKFSNTKFYKILSNILTQTAMDVVSLLKNRIINHKIFDEGKYFEMVAKVKKTYWRCYKAQNKRIPLLPICGLGASVGCRAYKRAFNTPRRKSQIGSRGILLFVCLSLRLFTQSPSKLLLFIKRIFLRTSHHLLILRWRHSRNFLKLF